MKNKAKRGCTTYDRWRESEVFPRPTAALESLRTELPTWHVSIFTSPGKNAPAVKNWGYYTEEPLPEIIVEVTKSDNPIKCRSKLFLACLVGLEHDSHIISYYQPSELIVMNFDGVEYYINADLWVDCKDGDVWLLNLIDHNTEQLCKKKPLLLDSVEVFCESINSNYFPIRDEDLIRLPHIGRYSNRIDDLGRLKIDAFPREGDW